MSTIELTQSTFNETLASNEVVFVDFWAAWCGPCRNFGPVFEKVSNEFPDAVFAKVDTEAEPALASAFNISSIPTLMAVRDQVVLYSAAGALAENQLRDLVIKVKGLDMVKVAQELANPETSNS